MRLFYKNLIIKTAKKTGGKAGKGLNKTSTIQVVKLEEDYSLMLKQIRYKTGDPASLVGAIVKAKTFVDNEAGALLKRLQSFGEKEIPS